MTGTGRKEENIRKRLRQRTPGGVHTYRHTHPQKHKHRAPPPLCIFICGCPHYMVPDPQSLSHLPAPACAALLPKLILHDPFTLFH